MKATHVFQVQFKGTLADGALEGSGAKVVGREGESLVVEVEAPDHERAVQRLKDALGPGAELEGVRVREPPGAGG